MKFQAFMNSKKNSCRGNYMRKYGMSYNRTDKKPGYILCPVPSLLYVTIIYFYLPRYDASF